MGLRAAGKALVEPAVRYGPVDVNTRDEIEQALNDRREGNPSNGVQSWLCDLTVRGDFDTIPVQSRPHRLVDQDTALSRPRQGFEFPWGHLLYLLQE